MRIVVCNKNAVFDDKSTLFYCKMCMFRRTTVAVKSFFSF
jgi:hypothetical protein